MAGRRERRHPAEAPPLCETRRWTRLFRKFTGGTWERQAPPRGAPSGATPPAGRGRTWAIHPAALSRLLRGVASRDQPPERLRFAPPPAAGRGFLPGVGHGSLPCAATAQQPNPGGVARTPPPVGSAWGQSRWSSGRPSHRLGPVVPGSFPSHLAMHGNRIGGRSAGAARSACLDAGASRLRRGTGRCWLGAKTVRVGDDGAPAGAVRGAPARCSCAATPPQTRSY